MNNETPPMAPRTLSLADLNAATFSPIEEALMLLALAEATHDTPAHVDVPSSSPPSSPFDAPAAQTEPDTTR